MYLNIFEQNKEKKMENYLGDEFDSGFKEMV